MQETCKNLHFAHIKCQQKEMYIYGGGINCYNCIDRKSCNFYNLKCMSSIEKIINHYSKTQLAHKHKDIWLMHLLNAK